MTTDYRSAPAELGASRITSPQLAFRQDHQSYTMGWYVQAVDDDPRSETGVRSPRKISPEGALLIARAFDEALSSSSGRRVESFEAGVRRQNEHARNLVREAAQNAERQAELVAVQHAEEARRRAADLAIWDNATTLTADDLASLRETAA